MPVAYTTTYYKIKEMQAPIKLIQGGQGAGKNIATELLIMDDRPKARVTTILTDTYPNLKDGPISDFEFLFEEWGMDFNRYFNKSEHVFYWGGRKIQFRHADDNKPFKGKGPRRDLLYINEGNRLGWQAVEHYIARSKEVIIDYNPDTTFWAHEELEPRSDCEKIIVTYKDNEMCPENEVRYIESRKHKTEWFRVYGLGLVGTYSDRRIYDFGVVDEIPKDAIRIPSGMDFGKSPDPTVLIDCYIKGVSLYVDEVFIENNLMPEKIEGAERMSIVDKMEEIGFEKNQMIIGDSSGATELKDLNAHGHNARGVKKTSVLLGMKRLGSYDIKVTKRSTTTIQALSNWLYDLDKNGKILPQPPKAHEPDTIAAIRYVSMARPLWEYLVPKVEEK
ncbi:hypothetical protein J0X14_14295 [Muricauda sp. CAU 1633]|uniref:hypothetical protein n=1 Tax=Allomuricauda sp. CAU 1633 TaxID=2816036 RepID=UPI001A8D566D|nr:hypothetical protein [Muricauda sp. CAU 1633]MBO0323475.1 hypothetical protein [Muricauda sp. CAU 1633]